jgi:flagellar basal body-associated protein FliL
MKKLGITLIITFIVVAFLSVGLVAALNASDATAEAYFSGETLKIGDTAFVRIKFISNTDQQLTIERVGINFDWTDADYFYGHTLSTPVTIGANESYVCDPILFQILYNVSAGSHSYYIGVDGTDASGNDFSWDAPTQTIILIGAGSTTTTPTPTPTSTGGGGGGTGSTPNWTIYVAVIAVVAIVIAVLFMVMEMRKKPKKATPEAESPKSEADKPKPASDQPLKDIEE